MIYAFIIIYCFLKDDAIANMLGSRGKIREFLTALTARRKFSPCFTRESNFLIAHSGVRTRL
jgi:hypothetical protein